MTKFATAWARPETIPACAGDKIYTWSYINSEGATVEETQDVYAKIQSYERMTHYKEYIDDNGTVDIMARGANTGAYADVTPFGSTIDDNNKYIANLVEELRQVIAQEQAQALKSANDKSAKIAAQAAKANTQGGLTNA